MFNFVPLAHLMQGRNNNFDFLRFFAASMVVFTHSFGLIPAGSKIEPLTYISQGHASMGGIAVAIFFVISGFLITMSYENTAGNREFLLKRSLRIFPGLAVLVLFSMFVLGPIFSAYPLAAYFSDIRTYTYLNNLFLFQLQAELPGVFINNPLPSVVNGSLWTLWYEFVCYLCVLGLGMAGLLRWKVILLLLGVGLFISINWANVPVIWKINNYLSLLRWQDEYIELLSYFFCGALIYLLRDRIPIAPVIAVLAFILLLLALRTDAFKPVFALAGSYLIIYLAFSRWLPLGNFSKRGDFSYGIYIYAYPVQQAVSQLMAPNLGWVGNFTISYPIILLCAIASWHWIESPTLAMKKRLHTFLIR